MIEKQLVRTCLKVAASPLSHTRSTSAICLYFMQLYSIFHNYLLRYLAVSINLAYKTDNSDGLK